jgi:S-adenosylmethionine-diacylglycerol 3-amino-3-carboxypropyl transferase
VPVRGNYFLHAYFKGTYRSLAEVPAYLQEKNFAIIKDRLNRIHIHTGDAKKWLATMPENTFECLGLSNICELMSLADTQKMFDEVLRTAKPRARISFRNLVLPREVPENLRSNIPKDIALSKEIMDSDRSFVYSKVAAYGVRK